MIHLENVSKTYETGSKAVRDLNLHIEAGEFVFIVGNSGSGKSTLIKLLLKELEPTSGSIVVDGLDITRMKRRKIPMYRRKIGVVFQDFRLLKDGREIKRRVPEILNMVGLAGKYKSYPRQLSGGEQQRVAIARALVNRPGILLADEPTGNLDPNNSWEIMNLLDEVNRQGTTVVVVTHNREIVDQMKKRVIAMKSGRIVSDEEEGGYANED